MRVAPFYKGKTITIVVGSSPGGGYDLYGRMIARHIGKHIPGNPSVVVNNMPGAASNVAAAYIYNVAPKDGTVIGALFMGAVVDPLFGNRPRPTHDMSKFNYIGNANKDVYVCLIRADAPVKNFAEALEKELIVGGTAEGASTRDFPELLKSLLGAKFKIVAGYQGSTQVNLAMERGEVQGGCGQSWSSVSATRAAAFKDGTIKVLAQEDTEGYPALNKQGVPLTRDFAKTDEQRRILDLVYSQTVFGRPYVVAPEVPKERVGMRCGRRSWRRSGTRNCAPRPNASRSISTPSAATSFRPRSRRSTPPRPISWKRPGRPWRRNSGSDKL